MSSHVLLTVEKPTKQPAPAKAWALFLEDISQRAPKVVGSVRLGEGSWWIPLDSDAETFAHLLAKAAAHEFPYSLRYLTLDSEVKKADSEY